MLLSASWFEGAALAGALGMACLFKPWLPLRHPPLQHPWCAAVLLSTWLWWTQHLLPNGLALNLGGSALLVLMFGWPLAMWTLLPVALLSQAFQARGWPDAGASIHDAVWRGVIPGTLALLMGLAVRRWLPRHVFVYILGRGFIVTALAAVATAALALWGERGRPQAMSAEEWMIAHWLMGWGEAIATGMLTAIFVAFKPHWLLTYSDSRYLPGSGVA